MIWFCKNCYLVTWLKSNSSIQNTKQEWWRTACLSTRNNLFPWPATNIFVIFYWCHHKYYFLTLSLSGHLMLDTPGYRFGLSLSPMISRALFTAGKISLHNNCRARPYFIQVLLRKLSNTTMGPPQRCFQLWCLIRPLCRTYRLT